MGRNLNYCSLDNDSWAPLIINLSLLTIDMNIQCVVPCMPAFLKV